MRVNNVPKVVTQWNSGTTRESNPGPRVRIPSALTIKPLSRTVVARTKIRRRWVSAVYVRVYVTAVVLEIKI